VNVSRELKLTAISFRVGTGIATAKDFTVVGTREINNDVAQLMMRSAAYVV